MKFEAARTLHPGGRTGAVFGGIGMSPLDAFRESFIGQYRLSLSRGPRCRC